KGLQQIDIRLFELLAGYRVIRNGIRSKNTTMMRYLERRGAVLADAGRDDLAVGDHRDDVTYASLDELLDLELRRMVPPGVPGVELAQDGPHLFRCLAFLDAERRDLAAWFDDPRRRDALEKSVYLVVIESTYVF